jgi:hypothetical protein
VGCFAFESVVRTLSLGTGEPLLPQPSLVHLAQLLLPLVFKAAAVVRYSFQAARCRRWSSRNLCPQVYAAGLGGAALGALPTVLPDGGA